MDDEKLEITEDNLILNNVITEDISETIDTYYLSFGDEEFKVIRFRKFSNDVGEMEDSFEFETDLELTDEDKGVIENFCLSQD